MPPSAVAEPSLAPAVLHFGASLPESVIDRNGRSTLAPARDPRVAQSLRPDA